MRRDKVGRPLRRKPPVKEQPVRPRTEIKEIEDDALAADLFDAIIRAGARTKARKDTAAAKEQKHDAA